MNHARKILDIQSPSDKNEPRRPLASWYTPGFSDGLGDRLLMFDNSPESSLELLRFNRRFGDRPTFENALRRRVEELEGFGHPSVAKVRAVEWLGPGEGLALVSNHTAGRRLSEVLHDAKGAAFAMELVRQLTPALASLQRQGQGIAHGALTAERIIVTPEGKLVIVEHVLGSALESLELPASRLRGDLGIAVRDDGDPLDARNDVVQLGLVALSLLLGRRVDPADYPDKGASLLAESAWGHRGSSLSTTLLGWLERALQLSSRTFESAQEAHDALNDLSEERTLVPGDVRRPLHAFTMAISAGESVSLLPLIVHEPTDEEPIVAESTTRLESVPRGPTNLIDYPRALPTPEESAPTETLPTPWPMAPVTTQSSQAPTVQNFPATPPHGSAFPMSERSTDPAPPLPRKDPVPMHFSGARLAIIGLSVLALGEAVFIAGLLYGRPRGAATPPPAASNAAAVTPPASPTGGTPPATTPAPGPQVASVGIPPATTPAADPREAIGRGTAPLAGTPASRMEVTSDPPGARVTVDGTPRGTTPLTISVRPGAHSVVVTDGNSTTTRNVNVLEGTTATVVAAFAPAGAAAGWLAITSPVELQVRENGTLIGTTGVARLMLPAGRHDLELSNPTLGFTTTIAVDIQPGKTATSPVVLPNGSLSINALPWANVFLDGRALGTTPIANLDVSLGTHEVIWRHPQFGERKQTVIVTAKAPVRLMMDLNK